ncbi:MAG: hypothetical protein ABEK84_00185 [Salinibacter sp.]
MSVQFLVILMVFLIPIFGILFAGMKEWLEFKAKHQELGSSTRAVEDRLHALQDRIDELEQQRTALQERVQNLETIVTSEAWIAEHEETSDGSSLNAAEIDELPLPDRDSSQSEAEHTARLAERLRGE